MMTAGEWAALGGASALLVGGGYVLYRQTGGLGALAGSFPTTAAGFGGNVALMQAFVTKYPPQLNVFNPQNALSWHLANDLSFVGPVTLITPSGKQTLLRNSQYGFPVAGVKNAGTAKTLQLQVETPPGNPAYYVLLQQDPAVAANAVVGKFVQAGGGWTLWQAYSVPKSQVSNLSSAQALGSTWVNAPQGAVA